MASMLVQLEKLGFSGEKLDILRPGKGASGAPQPQPQLILEPKVEKPDQPATEEQKEDAQIVAEQVYEQKEPSMENLEDRDVDDEQDRNLGQQESLKKQHSFR